MIVFIASFSLLQFLSFCFYSICELRFINELKILNYLLLYQSERGKAGLKCIYKQIYFRNKAKPTVKKSQGDNKML